MSDLRSAVIKLAHEKPELRGHLLPLLASYTPYEHLAEKAGNALQKLMLPVTDIMDELRDMERYVPPEELKRFRENRDAVNDIRMLMRNTSRSLQTPFWK